MARKYTKKTGPSFVSGKKKRKTNTKFKSLDEPTPGVRIATGDAKSTDAKSSNAKSADAKSSEEPVALKVTGKTSKAETVGEASKGATVGKTKKQAAFEGNGFDLPPAIQSIENAADELFNVLDEMTTLKERRETLKANVQGLMRAAGRKIYNYRDRTIRLEDIEKVKVRAPKHRRATKRVRGVKIAATHPAE